MKWEAGQRGLVDTKTQQVQNRQTGVVFTVSSLVDLCAFDAVDGKSWREHAERVSHKSNQTSKYTETTAGSGSPPETNLGTGNLGQCCSPLISSGLGHSWREDSRLGSLLHWPHTGVNWSIKVNMNSDHSTVDHRPIVAHITSSFASQNTATTFSSIIVCNGFNRICVKTKTRNFCLYDHN